MKTLKLIGLIMMLFITACESNSVPIDEEPNDETPIDIPPYIDYSKFENPFGFSALSISDKSHFSDQIVLVDNVVDFILALHNDETKVIEITADLSLGYKDVQRAFNEKGLELNDYRSVYRAHSRQPLLHPLLIETGVGQVRLVLKQDLMIFSQKGHVIKNTSFLIDGSSNIVIRNLTFDELWEWDEYSAGGYNRNDWDYFLIEKSEGIWLDHITFNQVYDGIIDIKEDTRHITLSWTKMYFEPNDFIEMQIYYLEEHRAFHPYYNSLRDKGLSVEDIILMSSFQQKGFNFGNRTDGQGFETITVTFHHLDIRNLQDRLPRIRKGDVHMYHIRLDNEAVFRLRERIHPLGVSLTNQAIVTTEEGAVLMENSQFNYVQTPIRNHQDSRLDTRYTGKYRIINSEFINDYRQYFGSSDDHQTLWVRDTSHPIQTFSFRNYETLPYQYTLQDVYFLNEILTNNLVGSGILEDFNWLYIDLSQDVKGD